MSLDSVLVLGLISMYFCLFAVFQPNFSDIRRDIPELKGDNYKI